MSLVDSARAVRENAYAPYSNFKVGAAVRGVSGAVHVGCNVENIAYPLGICGEAAAIAAMVAAGETEIVEIAIIADSPEPLAPCGGCRQKILEFATPATVITMANVAGIIRQTTIADLLPGAFDQAHMGIE